MHYAIGLFNGDGDDGSTAGAEHDEPEFAGRVAATPFKSFSNPLKTLQFGVSGSYAEIDTINVNLRVQSTGMVGTDSYLYVLSHNTKFGVIQQVGERLRLGAEAAWAVGPVLLQGEFIQLKYTGIQAAGANPSEAEFSSWYGAVAWWLTGESPSLAYKRDGAYLDAGVLNSENKLDGEGPFRIVVPQKYPGPAGSIQQIR